MSARRWSTQLGELENNSGGDQDRLGRTHGAGRWVQQRLSAADREVESLRAQAVELVHHAAQQRARISGLEKQKVDTQRLTENLLVEESELSQLCGDARSKHDDLVERDDALGDSVGRLARETWAIACLFKEVSGRVGDLMKQMNELKVAHQTYRSLAVS